MLRNQLMGGGKFAANLNISLLDGERDWIEAQIVTDRYSSASDSALIREDQRACESIQLALLDGELSSTSVRSVREIAHQARRRLTSDGDLQISRERLSGRKVDL